METPTKVIIYKQDRIDYILDGVARFYGVPKSEIGKYYRGQNKYKRKRLAVKLLVDVADLTYVDTARALDNSGRNNICTIYNNVSADVGDGFFGNKELAQEYKELLKFLNL